MLVKGTTKDLDPLGHHVFDNGVTTKSSIKTMHHTVHQWGDQRAALEKFTAQPVPSWKSWMHELWRFSHYNNNKKRNRIDYFTYTNKN